MFIISLTISVGNNPIARKAQTLNNINKVQRGDKLK
jgi:hypothetical protein